MKKSFIVLLAFVVLVNCFIFPVAAAVNPSVEPLWDNTTSVVAHLSFNGTTGTFAGSVIGDPDVDDILATGTLYYKNTSGDWVEISMPWGFVSTSTTLYFDEDFEGESGVEYKAVLNATVYVNYVGEDVSYTCYATCP